MATLGERLKELRKEKKLTQEQLADNFFVNKSSISRYEKNTQVPELEILIKIAEFFDVSVDYLLGRSDNRTTNLYSADINNSTYTIELDKELKKDLTKEELDNFIKYLISIDFNVEKALEKSNKNK